MPHDFLLSEERKMLLIKLYDVIVVRHRLMWKMLQLEKCALLIPYNMGHESVTLRLSVIIHSCGREPQDPQPRFQECQVLSMEHIHM